MNIQDIILTRRSIRKYKTDAVSEEQIETMLKAGMYAPSANNKQPWSFIVVDDRAMLNKIMGVHPYSKMLKEAPLAIVVCSDELIEPMTSYWIQDCSAAVQNILLSAAGMGLGTCWLGVNPREDRMRDVSELFELPSHIQPLAIIAVGHPDEVKEMPDRFIKSRIHRNKWSK